MDTDVVTQIAVYNLLKNFHKVSSAILDNVIASAKKNIRNNCDWWKENILIGVLECLLRAYIHLAPTIILTESTNASLPLIRIL